MGILLTIVGIIAGLIILLLIIAAFTKSDYAVERSIAIKNTATAVYDYIKLLKNQDHYSKWAKMDPAMKKEYFGTDGQVGFRSTWDSDDKKVGKGEQEITELIPGKSIKTRIRFIKPFDGFADAQLETISQGEDETQVKWSFQSKMKYPMNAMLLFMDMEKMIGTDLEIGLNNLKNILENN